MNFACWIFGHKWSTEWGTRVVGDKILCARCDVTRPLQAADLTLDGLLGLEGVGSTDDEKRDAWRKDIVDVMALEVDERLRVAKAALNHALECYEREHEGPNDDS
jgi:hypothetical protein